MKRAVLLCDLCGDLDDLDAAGVKPDWYELSVQHKVGSDGQSGPAHIVQLCSFCWQDYRAHFIDRKVNGHTILQKYENE